MDIGNITLNDSSIDADEKLRYLLCAGTTEENEYDGYMGVRISALFVILATSSLAIFFPVVARRVKWLRIPLSVYLFARYFGTGVIIATAFIHLLDPAYGAIGSNTCVGMTGGWTEYAFVPGIVLVTVMAIFFLDFAAKLYVERKFGIIEEHGAHNPEHIITPQPDGVHTHNGHLHEAHTPAKMSMKQVDSADETSTTDADEEKGEVYVQRSFEQQIAAFYILEFGIIFHSIIIGLNLAVAGWDEFKELYIVLVFHQAFEGLGIGARMSAIPFPRHLHYMPWVLCAAYGLTTPIAIAIGLGVRTTYRPESFTASVVSGVLDSISAGILIYTGLIELLAADFLFNTQRTKSIGRLLYMLTCIIIGIICMALLGKWA